MCVRSLRPTCPPGVCNLFATAWSFTHQSSSFVWEDIQSLKRRPMASGKVLPFLQLIQPVLFLIAGLVKFMSPPVPWLLPLWCITRGLLEVFCTVNRMDIYTQPIGCIMRFSCSTLQDMFAILPKGLGMLLGTLMKPWILFLRSTFCRVPGLRTFKRLPGKGLVMKLSTLAKWRLERTFATSLRNCKTY